jgi:uncharacterized membrane protein YkoI
MSRRSIAAGAAAALLVVGVGGAAIGANLTLLGTERDASTVGRLEIVTARAQLATTGGAGESSDASTGPGRAGSAPAALTGGITAERAIAIAAAEVGGTFVKVEWTTERGRSVFEVERRLADGTRVEVSVDAADGTVLAIEREGRVDDREAERAWSGVTDAIPSDAAVGIARAAVGGGELVEVGRSEHRGRAIWEVYLREGGRTTEVYVDAISGDVLEIDIDD